MSAKCYGKYEGNSGDCYNGCLFNAVLDVSSKIIIYFMNFSSSKKFDFLFKIYSKYSSLETPIGAEYRTSNEKFVKVIKECVKKGKIHNFIV